MSSSELADNLSVDTIKISSATARKLRKSLNQAVLHTSDIFKVNVAIDYHPLINQHEIIVTTFSEDNEELEIVRVK